MREKHTQRHSWVTWRSVATPTPAHIYANNPNYEEVLEYSQYTTACFGVCVCRRCLGSMKKDKLLKKRVKIATLLKGIQSAPRGCTGYHIHQPPSLLNSHSPSQWIYYPLPLSTGMLNEPQLLNFEPRVNLVFLMGAAELQ